MAIRRRILAFAAAVVVGCAAVRAETALVAVASNFAEAADDIKSAFEVESGHRITITLGATGKIYAQIRAGAPYDAFLAADQERPRRLQREGLARVGSRFTYAIGQLTLWSADAQRVAGDPKAVLSGPAVRAFPIANPALAPYGLATRQALQKMGLWQALAPRVVTGENISQALALTATGNAELGFVATPLLKGRRGKALGGSGWDVPADLHAPIRQDAVLLERAGTNAAAAGFLDFLRGPKARAIMVRLGYKPASE